MEIFLALGAAVSYGVSDFAGGALTRRMHVFVVFLLSQRVSLAVLAVAVTVGAGAIAWSGWRGGRWPGWQGWPAPPSSTRGWRSAA